MELDGPTMGGVMYPKVATLSEQATVGEAVDRRQQGQWVVLLDDAARPIGVLADDWGLQDFHRIPLRALGIGPGMRLMIPAITRPEIPVYDALGAWGYDHSIGCYVVMRRDEIVGIVPVSWLLPPFPGRGDADLPGGKVQFGPPNFCYRCSNTPQHQYRPEAVELRDYIGQPVCPVDRTVMFAHIPCDERTG
jgi:hypothetical protein